MAEYRGKYIEFAFTEQELKDMFAESTNKQFIPDNCPAIWKFVQQISEYVE